MSNSYGALYRQIVSKICSLMPAKRVTFYDYEHIESLGLCSALCVPILDDHAKDIGTVNLGCCKALYPCPIE